MTDDGLQWNSTFEEEIQTTPSNLTDDAEIQLNVSGIMGEQSINLTTDNELNNEAEIDSDSTLDPPTDPPTASSTLSIMDDFSNPYTLSFSIESNLERSRFGSSVAISSDGKVLAIGATDARNEFGDATGAVYLYGISSAGGSGVSQTFLQAIHGESAGDFFGGAIAMSEYGNHIVIGSRAEGGLVGAMRVYERKNPSIVNDWTPMGDAIVGETPSGQAGWSVAISGDGNIVAMGAPKGGNGGGAVEAFKYGLNSSLALVWLPHGSVVMGPALDEAAGYSISLSHNGRIIAIGSPKASNPIGAPFSGKTSVYSFTGIGWMKVSEIFGDAASDIDGTSVALSGDGKVLVVGGKGRDENSLSNVGYCRIFEWKDTPFGFSYSLIGEIAEERIGYFVAISPDGNVVSCGGVNGNLNGVANTGTVRVFNRGTLQESTIWPRGDTISTWEASSFGSSIALSSDGRYLVVGAPAWSGSSGDLNGAVQVFNFY